MHLRSPTHFATTSIPNGWISIDGGCDDCGMHTIDPPERVEAWRVGAVIATPDRSISSVRSVSDPGAHVGCDSVQVTEDKSAGARSSPDDTAERGGCLTDPLEDR